MSKRIYSDPRTAVKRCVSSKCDSVFQDATYGKHMRLHNRTNQKEDKSQQSWRCTICSTVRTS